MIGHDRIDFVRVDAGLLATYSAIDQVAPCVEFRE
jgi:hypothetical protein